MPVSIMDLLSSPRRTTKRELPVAVGGKTKSLKRELPVGGKRKRLAMEQLRVGVKKGRLARDLPEELIINEILTLLPIKSVLRFKCVSKSWLSLISDSHFIKKYHTCSSMQNPNDYDCLVANKDADRGSNITIVSRDRETFVLPCQGYSLIGSVNGLVCLLLCPKRVSLWNPTIRQSMEFNLPQDKEGGHSLPILVRAGFDPVSNDYKVVVCYPLLDSCAVYSSNSNLWIQLPVPRLEFLMNKREESSFVPTTYVKDCPYWTYSTYSSDKGKCITFLRRQFYGTYPSTRKNFVKSLATLKFDATSNKFKWLPEFCPDAQSCKRNMRFKFVIMRDLLTLLAYQRSPTGKLEVYCLEEEKGCDVWIKMHQVDPFEQFQRIQDLQQGFKYGDDIVFFENDKIHYYDHKTNTFKCLLGKDAIRLLNLFTYTPNMVWLQGMKSIYAHNQTRPLGDPERMITSIEE